MNIAQLMRALTGDLQPADPKVLELKIGQIVKGVLLQMLSDHEALINIAGTQVKAKLESPLPQGQVTLLQVQPESQPGSVVLKPLQPNAAAPDGEGILKSLGLKNTPENRAIVRDLQASEAGLPKENIQSLRNVLSEAPKGVASQEWTQAAALALKRGLPLKGEVVGALRQALYGAPLDKLLGELHDQLEQFVRSGAGDGSGKAQQAAARLEPLLSRLDAAEEALVQAFDERADAGKGSQPPIGAAAGKDGNSMPTSGREAAIRAKMMPQPSSTGSTEAGAHKGGGVNASVDEQARNRSTEGTSEQAGADVSRKFAAAQSNENGRTLSAFGARAASAESPAKQAANAQQPRPSGEQVEQTALPTRPNIVQTMLKLVGLDHEHQVWKAFERSAMEERQPGVNARPEVGQPIPETIKAAQDSLKSLLMQIGQSDDAPQALKDTANQLVQHLTGQQLLLTPDRTASMFAHVTMFIPFRGPDGEQTAAVHVQSRKNGKGELDASNCRLLFDLRMKSLGDTLVEVQVTDRIVGLHIHNNHPVLGEIAEGQREAIGSALQGVGYQLLSMKVSPFPEPAEADSASFAAGIHPASVSPASKYSSKPYKGVDFRV